MAVRRQRPAARSDAASRDVGFLKTIAEALNGAANVDDALRVTLEQVAALLGLDTAWVWLTDPASGRFYGAVAQRLPPFLQEPVRMAGQSCWCLRAFRAGELTAGNIDVMECSRLRAAVAAADRARARGLRYHASIPLYFSGRPLGIMNVAAPAWRQLTARELDLLSTIASQVGVAIERARLADEHVQVARIEERTRLARELHDTVAQGLTAIGFQVEAAIDVLPMGAPARRPLGRALDLSRSALDEARRSIAELRSAESPSLSRALATLAHTFAADTGVRAHVRVLGQPALTAAHEAEVLRVAAEALANVRKHAGAADVDIALGTARGKLRLAISDNGRGFDTRARAAGFGIAGMKERARRLGGELTVSSRRGRGTRVTLTLPAGGRAPADIRRGRR